MILLGQTDPPTLPRRHRERRWYRISQSSLRFSQALKTSKPRWRPEQAVSIGAAFAFKAFVESRLGIPFSSCTKGVGGMGCQGAQGLQRFAFRGALRAAAWRRDEPEAAEEQPGSLCVLGALEGKHKGRA